MKMSPSIGALATALAKAQGEIRGALKDTTNPFFKSKYADLGSVVEAIREPLAKHGLSYTQMLEPSDKEEVRVETMMMHGESGEWISSVCVIPVSKADAQGYGSAMTYARRYGLSAAFGVAPEDDDGNAAAKAKPPEARWRSDKGDALKSMDEGQMDRIRKTVSSVFDWLNADDVAAACNRIDSEKFDADEKVALWTFFDSKQRAAMKKHWEKVNPPAKKYEESLGSQA